MKRQKAFSPDLLRDIHSEPTLRPISIDELETTTISRELVPLSTHEERRFEECEQIITDGLNTFMEVGQALTEIRNRRLYRGDFKTFEAYAHQKWGIKRQRAYELMGASEVARNLSEISDILPAKESHAASLLRLSPEDQREAWQEIIDEAGENVTKLTAGAIRKKVNERLRIAENQNLTYEEQQARQVQEEAIKPLSKAMKKSPEQLFITVTGAWLIKNNLEPVWRELRGVSRKIDANFSDVITLGEAFELGILKPGK
jgi:hypothetical protein